mgnify:CR=1 FL=1
MSDDIIPGAGGDIHAERIEAEHRAATGAARTAIEHAAECGRLLIAAKAAVGHGGWLAWVDKHLSFGARQAAKYMRLHRHRRQLANRNRSSDLGVTAAFGLLATPKQRSEIDDQAEVDAQLKALERAWEKLRPVEQKVFGLAIELVGVGDMPKYLLDLNVPTLQRLVELKRSREAGQ